MSNKEPKIHHYQTSFLLFWHILLGGAFIFDTIVSISGYTKNITQGTILTLIITLSFFYLLYFSAKLFNKQKIGSAYLLTISGFLVGVFVQMSTCMNSIELNFH